MSSVREPAIDAQAATLVPNSNRGASQPSDGEDPTQVIGRGPPPEDPVELEAGAMIARYRVLGRLGAGGMGVVYRAHDAQLDREVAIKLLRMGEGGTEGRDRMLREAKAAAKIRHANVVTVYDAGEVFGRVFIVMELIDGVTLKAHFRGKKRGWRAVVEVMLAAGEGLAAAHAAGLVHRDFKPDNVLVEASGRVRVLDFGLARPAFDVEGPTQRTGGPMVPGDAPPVLRTLTQTGMLVGTPAYMAPEQHLARGVDARTDQFAYCVSFYECLYGQRPFAGDTQAELTLNVIEGRLLPPRERGDVPAEILAVLATGMQVHPADRYPSMAALLGELRAIVRRHEPRDRRGLMIAAGVLLPVLVGAAMLASTGPGATPAPEERAAAPEAANVEPEVTPAPSVPAPERVGVAIGRVQRVEPTQLAALLAQVVPRGLDVEAVDRVLRIVGEGAGRWRPAGEMLLAALDVEFSGRPAQPLVTQVPTPDGMVGVYLIDGAELPAAIRKLEGVLRVGHSEALGVALVLGDAASAGAVARLLREARAPKFRAWCFENESMPGDKECRPTREACEKEEAIWFKDKRGRCKGVR